MRDLLDDTGLAEFSASNCTTDAAPTLESLGRLWDRLGPSSPPKRLRVTPAIHRAMRRGFVRVDTVGAVPVRLLGARVVADLPPEHPKGYELVDDA